MENNKNQIIATLRNYAIEIQKISATVGPTVTLYEIVPAPGIRISKIKNLEDDLAHSLAALGIRIIAPFPEKEPSALKCRMCERPWYVHEDIAQFRKIPEESILPADSDR